MINATELEIVSLNISEKTGVIKKPVPEVNITGKGIENDAHAGNWHRQVSMLALESVERFEKIMGRKLSPGEFAENITTKGIEVKDVLPLDKFLSQNVELEVTQIGKKCHGTGCAIFNETGNCVMPKEGIFLRVKKTGKISAGEKMKYKPKTFRFYIVTLSDRASNNEYEDLSGPRITAILKEHFLNSRREISVKNVIIPDCPEELTKHFNIAVDEDYDALITTGGTGIGPRDITVETIQPLLDKEIPGIMEHIRIKYGSEKPNALLSRGIAGIKSNTFVYTLPGSVKAVNEYMHEILGTFEHLVYMLNGIDNH